jgi:hypothetical protein
VFLTKCTAGTGKRGIYPWHGCPIFKELNFTYMREEKSYYEIKRERKLRDTGNQMRFFFLLFRPGVLQFWLGHHSSMRGKN